MARKTYPGPVVDVSFDGEVCQHSENCVRGMAAVFDVTQRPWINPDRAPDAALADELRRVVGTCPSGALRIEEHD
jgi:uncharacterized Fe-S cluster protein YjdI